MTKRIILLTVGIAFLSFTFKSDFLAEQKKFKKVRQAIKEKQLIIEKRLAANNLVTDNFYLLMVAYKKEGLLELFAKSKNEDMYKKLITYTICAQSGDLGPKRQEGDNQVPEGFYFINCFNPNSAFYLSLGINYPNQSDKQKSKSKKLGGNIFIHGSCVTIGCLPMTDEKIKEIYLYSVYAKRNGQVKIPVYIFPFKMDKKNMLIFKEKYKNNNEILFFWNNLKIGYDMFLKDSNELNVSTSENGDYRF
jgi:murein L,D-transpeptidase YafK